MKADFKIPVIYQDEYLMVVEKPSGLAVHKNDFMPHDALYLTKLLGEMTGRWIYNVHRLDSKTSGIIVLAFSSETAHQLTLQFEHKKVVKKYHAIVLGNPEEGTFDAQVRVKKKSRQIRPAVTHFITLKTRNCKIPYKQKDHVTLSLVEVTPETGRWHQIRQHFAQKRFGIVGDTYHGDFELNKTVAETTGVTRLLLHASTLRFNHPVNDGMMEFFSSQPDEFHRVLDY
jgi:tRNA pseudouridine65 synthase